MGVADATNTSAASPSAARVESPDEAVPTDVRRSTIIVRNMDTSLKLYRDVIGLEVNYDTEVTTSGVALPAGEPGATARLMLLNSNDPWVGWVGPMEWVDPVIPADDALSAWGQAMWSWCSTPTTLKGAAKRPNRCRA